MINGILNIYKKPGFTSHDVVAKLRGIVRQKKIGHTGTLDPDAEGVLPVCLGKATRLCGLLTEESKTYEAVLLLGVSTDTQDTSGQVLSRRPVTCSEAEVIRCLEGFLGPQMQIPPMYSALKRDGKKLYELARQGVEVAREPRPVHFYEITVLETALPRITFRVSCSRGTYIRTLCHDAGEKLGCGGCMERLVRTRVGNFVRERAYTLEQVENLVREGRLSECLLPVDGVFAELPAFSVLPEGDAAAHNGNPLDAELLVSGTGGEKKPVCGSSPKTGERQPESADACRMAWAEQFRLYDSDGTFVGLYGWAGRAARPVKMFYDGPQGQ